MKINNINTVNTNSINTKENLGDVKKIPEEKQEQVVVFEKSQDQNLDKSKAVYDRDGILKLKRESEAAHQSLIRIVEDLLRRQGKTLKLLSDDDIVEVDETARLEAQELIGEDGPLGAEAVSTRLVDFAIKISGGDKSKAGILKDAIEKGFKEAEKILGELPEISKKTYDLTMEKFDNWVNS